MENMADVIAFPQEFTVEAELKASQRGRVLLVRDKETKLRHIYRTFAGDGEVYRRLCGVSCPYLPGVRGFREENGQVTVLEEYVQGDTLAFALEGKPLDTAQVKSIGVQLCQALEVLHGIGAVHRDIKPENILLRGGEAVLIDFDASRVCKAESNADTQIMGTTGYAAPEQYGFSQTDARADIYAMGVLLNEMLTKQHPSKRLAAGELRPVIERCIEVNVDKRYRSVSELRAALLACGGKREKKWKKPAALTVGLAAVFALGMLCGTILGEGKEAAAPETTAETVEETQAALTVEVFQRQTVEVSDEPWQGVETVYETPFRYDLDGDGEMEDYRFGVYQARIPEGYRNSLSDTFGLESGESNQRDVYPCVWKYGQDGSAEMVREFAGLLADTEVTVWRAKGNEAAAPEVCTIWDEMGQGIQALYTLECEGTWLYSVHASLEGQELTALARSNVVPADAQ